MIWIIGTIVVLYVVTLIWVDKRRYGAFDIDETCWYKVRDKVLRDRYAGVVYSTDTSLSPVIIQHRESLSLKDRHRIQKMFPSWIRLEFQQVYFTGEKTVISGIGSPIVMNLLIQAIDYMMDKNTRPAEYTKVNNQRIEKEAI